MGYNQNVYEVFQYETSAGKIPFLEWMRSLRDETVRIRLRVRISGMKFGQFGDHKSVGDGIFELRCHFGPGYRIYFAFQENKLIMLLCGGDKSTQVKDIQVAKKYWEDYKWRNHEGRD
jgi:putative addiction module killer protein